jgi:predicted  nucleic acid-binding Zn-ribbon protein
MRHVTCENCGGEFPRGESFEVLGKTSCRKCLEQAIAQGAKYHEQDIRRLVDPTVCGNCGNDAGDFDHALLAGVPMCEACIHRFRHRPFPVWIKIAGAAVVVLALFSFARNLRFIQGHIEANRAGRAFQAGDLDAAADLMAAAAAHVPECQVHQQERLLLRGIQLGRADKNAEAVRALTECRKYGKHKFAESLLV